MGNVVQVRNCILGEGKPKICVSIVDSEPQDIIESAKTIVNAKPDLVEWRVDCFEGFNDPVRVCAALKILRGVLMDIPLIFTIRTAAEGGNADITPSEYREIYIEAAKEWAVDIFDVEYALLNNLGNDFPGIIKSRAKLLISMHDFNKTPATDKMVDDLIRMQMLGADIAKLAVMPNTSEDVDSLFAASVEMKNHHNSTPIVTISMGALGVRSRIEGSKTGSCFTFATVGQESAPGQLPIDLLRIEMDKLEN